MKIIAILENEISAGGGFNQALNAVLQMQRISSGKFDFEVFTAKVDNIRFLKEFGVNAKYFSFSLIDNLLSVLSFSRWWQIIQFWLKIVGPFEKTLIKHNCDLVYFVKPSVKSSALQRLNYIATVWDLCHRDMPEFPEVRNFNQFYSREHHYKNCLSPAVVVLVDSESLVELVSKRYGVDRERLLPMPFAPSPFLDSGTTFDKVVILKKYSLDEGYFFYPAQFWAHKNHIRILEALLILREKGFNFTVVFVGGDQGNRQHVEQFINHHKLNDAVRILGFVPNEDMTGLYKGCKAVVMPTYFGPTNLPPLEAWKMEKPLIYPSQFSSQVGSAAILINPDDATELAEAMEYCTDKQLCEKLIKKGLVELIKVDRQRKKSEVDLIARLEQFEKRLRCWI